MITKAKQIIALIGGHPGPFFESEESFYGAKRTNSTMKDSLIETDCGGSIITKSTMTYGQADKIAASIDTNAVADFVRTCKGQSCCWKASLSRIYYGELWWAIYSYLATTKVINGDPQGYNNSLEYLFDLIAKRLVADGFAEEISGSTGYLRMEAVA